MRYLYISALALFAVILLLFCFQNTAAATVKFLGWSTTVPMPLLALVIYVLGMLTGSAVWAFLRRSVKAARRPGAEPTK